MPIEHEVKFLRVEKDTIRARLERAGASCAIPERIMRRTVLDYPDRSLHNDPAYSNRWVRVRDEGNKVTLTYKQVQEHQVAGTEELEVVVSDFDTTVRIFEAIGLQSQGYYETKRETWHYDDVEVVIDEWPFIEPFVEIEGSNQESIMAAAKALGFVWEEGVFGSVNVVYRLQYPGMAVDEDVSSTGGLSFDMPLPQWLEERR